MKKHFAIVLCLIGFSVSAQLPKWILGSSQQNSSNAFYTYGPGNLKFYEVNFKGTLSSTPRTIGTSIQNIKSVGTQDVMQTAVDTTANSVLFYVFDAATGPWNNGFPTISPDTFYFAAYNSLTGADEIFGKVPSTGWGASVIESELVQKPGSSTEYYFIYKTQSTSNYLDYIRYVTVDVSNKTVSLPTNLVTLEKSGEGMAVSQLNCSNQRWLFVTRPESNGNITLRRCTISNTGITPAVDTYTISIPGNSTNVVVGVEIAPTNNYLAVGNYNNTTVNKNMILFDYNNNTGSVSNERYYQNALNYPFVTMEFSPNGSRVYILQGGSGSVPNVIYNCPVSSSNYTVTAANQLSSMTLNQSLTLETAYDGNIYVDPGQSSTFMYIINNPNSATPTITSTATNFFGSNDRVGSGFPDQVDGDKYAKGPVNVAVAASSTSLCPGQTTTLTATSSGTSYQWSGGSTSTSSVIAVSPVSTSTYVMTASNGTCSAKDSVIVSVTPTPTLSIVATSTLLCAGQSATLTANGSNQYQWSGGSSATTSTIVVSPNATTNYTVQGSTNGCSSAPVSITVSVSPTPTVSVIASSTVVCPGQTATLTASGSSSYQWSGGSNATTPVVVVSPPSTTDYTVIGTDNGCPSLPVSITVSVSASPTVTITATSTSICPGQTTTLTASGANSYQWSGGSTATTSVITDSPVATTTYVVTGTIGGCSAQDSIVVQVAPAPTATITGNLNICAGETTTLTATGGTTYQWSGGSSATTSVIIVGPATSTTYSVIPSNGSCSGNPVAVTVSVTPIPTATINPSTIVICPGQSATLTASGGTSYQWSGGSTDTSSVIVVSPDAASTNYTVTVSDGGCSANAVATVSVSPTITITPAVASICSGQSVTITASGGNSYQWSGGSTATTSVITVTPANTSTYVVSVTSGSCSAADSVTIHVTPSPTVTASGNQIICPGQTATLTATGGNSYQWSGGSSATTSVIAVTPTLTTTYSVTTTTGTCTSAPATLTVSVAPVPNIAITASDTIICPGQTSTITASGGGTYQWSGGSTSNNSTIFASPTNTTTYVVTVSNGTCTAADSLTIHVLPSSPTVTASGNFFICSGQTTTLTASGAPGYQWSGGSTATTSVIVVSPTTTTNYTVTPISGSCPATSFVLTVTVTPTPTIVVSGSQNICSGQSATLTASGASSYHWSNGITDTAGTVIVSPSGTTTYSVTSVNGPCASAPAFATVSVTPSPTLSVNGAPTNICAGQSATLTASGATSYQWSGGSSATTSVIVVSPSGNQTYTVTGSNGICAGDSATISVAVTPIPTISVSPSQVICSGQVATLTVSGASTYQWSGGSTATTATIIVDPTSTTTYTVIGSNGSCAGAPASTTVNVTSTPTISVNGNQNICSGQSTTLTASGASSYQWSGGSSATTSVIVVSPASSTNYVVSGSSLGCPAAAVLVTVSVTPSPTVIVGGDQTICSGQTTTLTASGGASYQWTGSTSTGSTIAVTPNGTTVYTVTAINGNCASTPAIVTVSVTPAPVIVITSSDSFLCSGHSATLTATGGSFYQWSGGSTSSSSVIVVNPATTSSYTVSGVTGNCSGSTNITLPVLPFVAAQFSYSLSECLPPTVNFTSASAGTHYWDFGDGTTSSVSAPTHLYNSGTYVALLITNAGTACADSSGHTINVAYPDQLIIPNIFTPNGDGVNDELSFSGLDPCSDYDLTIYNRWGKKVFETPTPQTEFWNGTINGKNADDDTYFFILEPANSKNQVIKGYITIIR